MKSIVVIIGIYAFIAISFLAAVVNIAVAFRNVSKYFKYKRTQKRRAKNMYLN